MDVLKAGLNVLTHLFMKEYLFHLTCLMLGFKKKNYQEDFLPVHNRCLQPLHSVFNHKRSVWNSSSLTAQELSSCWAGFGSQEQHGCTWLLLLFTMVFSAISRDPSGSSSPCITLGCWTLLRRKVRKPGSHGVFPYPPQRGENWSFSLICLFQKCYSCQTTFRSCDFLFKSCPSHPASSVLAVCLSWASWFPIQWLLSSPLLML